MKTEPPLTGPDVFKNIPGPPSSCVRAFEFQAVRFLAIRWRSEKYGFETFAHARRPTRHIGSRRRRDIRFSCGA